MFLTPVVSLGTSQASECGSFHLHLRLNCPVSGLPRACTQSQGRADISQASELLPAGLSQTSSCNGPGLQACPWSA
jgi:hypothetical protein